MDGPPIYVKSDAGCDQALAQGEIISGLTHAHLYLPSLITPPERMLPRIHPFAVILSQGCDLEQDHRAKINGDADKRVPTVLFCEVHTATELRAKLTKSSSLWDRVKQNNDERYHFFQKVEPEFDAAGEGLDELGVDFKRFFAIPTDEVYHRVSSGEAKRRCCLSSPYLEHFCRRFANFISRIALPVPHQSV